MNIQGIWDCPNQDQEVGAKHINDTKMFQMTSKEPMELIDEEVGDLVELEYVSESKHTSDSIECTDKANEDNPNERANPEESALIQTYYWIECI